MRESTVVPMRIVLLGLVLGLTLLGLGLPIRATAAQQGSLPEVGDVLLDDPLTAPGALRAGGCPSRRNVGQFVGEGFRLSVTGRCEESSRTASVSPGNIRGLDVGDGEVWVEVRAVAGQDRVSFFLGMRAQGDPFGSYEAVLQPASGRAALLRVDSEGVIILAQRTTDLDPLRAAGDWNSLAIRARGANLWVLLNDEPILSAVDSTHAAGSAYMGLSRIGSPDDDAESAVISRNLRVSALAGEE